MHDRGKRRIRESYDSLGGKLYDIRYQIEQDVKYDVILRRSPPSLEKIVLDDGCGTGLLLERLGNTCVGVDLSHHLLSKARSRLRKRRRIHLIQADADLLPFRDQVFGEVFAVTLIQNTPNPEHSLSEMRRVARAGSEVVVTALKKAFTLQGLKQLLEASGLALTSIIQDEELKDWIAFTIQ